MTTRLIVIRAAVAGAIALEVFGDRWIAPMRMTRGERSVCETEPTAEED